MFSLFPELFLTKLMIKNYREIVGKASIHIITIAFYNNTFPLLKGQFSTSRTGISTNR